MFDRISIFGKWNDLLKGLAQSSITKDDIIKNVKKVKFTPRLETNGLFMNGSLVKYYFNQKQSISYFFREDVKAAIEKMSNDLGFDISNFNVYRLDLAVTFIMNHPIHCYDDFLAYKSGFKIIKFNYNRIMDDLREIQAEDDNLLRIDIKLKKNVYKIFNNTFLLSKKHLLVKELYDKKIYYWLLSRWKEGFDIACDRANMLKNKTGQTSEYINELQNEANKVYEFQKSLL